jgi:hypothetical protein
MGRKQRPPYGESDCGDAYVNYTGPFSNGLIGCPLDTLKASQMAALPMLVGNWDFVNETNRPGISGTMKFGANGDVNMTVPSKTAFGDYRLETSWGYIGHNILTQCMPSGGCENSTLTTITPNHIEFTDNHGDRIHLMRGGMALIWYLSMEVVHVEMVRDFGLVQIATRIHNSQQSNKHR